SRRRHTRFSRDWSSDVCSSDLGIRNAQSRGAVQAGAAAAAGELFDLRESAEGIEDIRSRYGEVSGFDKIIGDIEEMGEALREARPEERRVGTGGGPRWRARPDA